MSGFGRSSEADEGGGLARGDANGRPVYTVLAHVLYLFAAVNSAYAQGR
jgi:hypothetical protein